MTIADYDVSPVNGVASDVSGRQHHIARPLGDDEHEQTRSDV